MADLIAPVPDAADQEDLAAQERNPEDIAKHWNTQLDLADKDHKEFRENGKRVLRRYKTEKDDSSRSGGRQTKRFNILYSNTEMLLAALYGKMATPDVRRRYIQSDPMGESVAEIIEGALVYCNEVYGDKPIEAAIKDYLLPGRGTVRIEYEPKIVNAGGAPQIVDQIVREKYVYWEDFLCMSARTWSDIEANGWVAFRHRMTRTELVDNFGEIGREVPLNWAPDIGDRKHLNEASKKAEVWEIWDITDRRRYWIVRSFTKPLRVDDDPYGLEGFFPVPEPISYYTTTDTIIPEPEFFVYKDQADDLDEITNRISRLTKALKRRGVYDQSVKELSRLASAGDNQFIPVENYANLATKGGLQASFQTEDISVVAEVLLNLYSQRDKLVQQIWELCGMADVMRGQSDPSKTLGANQMEAQFGSGRVQRRQRTIQRWIRDLMRIKAEIIAEHFEPQVLQQITGQQITPEIIDTLRSDKLRSYRIDIETDSTIFEDEQEEQQARGNMIGALTKFIEGWGPIAAQQPVMVPLAFELMKFGLGGFKAIRPIEDAIDQAASIMNERAQQGQFQPPPSPDAMRAQADIQVQQSKAQAQVQIEQQKAQSDAHVSQQKLEHESALAELKHKHAISLEQQQAQQEAMFAQQKHEHELAMREQEHHHKQVLETTTLKHKHDMEVGDAVAKIDTETIAGGMSSPIVKAIEPIVQEIGRALLAQTQQQTATLQAQMKNDLKQILQTIVEASRAPRRRVAIRDADGRIVEAHDMPMGVH